MQVNIDESLAVVTGAGRGNGEAIAKRLAENGASVIVNDLELEPAEETVTDIESAGGTATAVTADVGSDEEIEEMFDYVREQFDRVDILVNNAGVGAVAPITEKPSAKKWSEVLESHIWGAINCCTQAVDMMTSQGYGKIINITSIHTKHGVGMTPQYDVAKFGMLGLTRSLAQELGREGVRVNAVAPGWTNTRMTAGRDTPRGRIVEQNPLGRFAEPEEIANAVLFLASPASDYINGHELRVDGGQVPIDSWKK